MRGSHKMAEPATRSAAITRSRRTTRSLVLLICLVSSLLMSSSVTAQASFNPYLYGTNNYLAASLYNGLWWMQGQCHWGIRGTRSGNVYQCGTFSCPTLWYGSTQYLCPPPTLYSNSLQRCVRPSTLAKVKRCGRAS